MKCFASLIFLFLASFSLTQAAENYNERLRFWDDLNYERGNLNRVWIEGGQGCKQNENPLGNKIIQSKSSTLSYDSYGMDLSHTIDVIMTTPNFPTFNSLYLRGSKLGGKNLRRLNEVISSRQNSITDLYFGENSFAKDDIQLIANFMLRNMKDRIQILDVEDVGLSSQNSSTLASALPDLRNLRALYLGKNSLGDKGFSDLMNGLQYLRNLQILSVKSADITDDSMRRLAEILPMLPNLQILDLKGNNISEVGFAKIFRIAITMPSLIVIDINSGVNLNQSSQRLISQITSCSAYSSDIFLTPVAR